MSLVAININRRRFYYKGLRGVRPQWTQDKNEAMHMKPSLADGVAKELGAFVVNEEREGEQAQLRFDNRHVHA